MNRAGLQNLLKTEVQMVSVHRKLQSWVINLFLFNPVACFGNKSAHTHVTSQYFCQMELSNVWSSFHLHLFCHPNSGWLCKVPKVETVITPLNLYGNGVRTHLQSCVGRSGSWWERWVWKLCLLKNNKFQGAWNLKLSSASHSHRLYIKDRDNKVQILCCCT